MAIGEMASEFGLAPHVLRHWEDMGVLTPPRDGNGRRVYGPAEATRIALILFGKDAGLTLEQTRRLLTPATDRETRHALFQHHSDQLRKRIAAAEASLAIIDHAAKCEAEDITNCPHLYAKVAGRLRS